MIMFSAATAEGADSANRVFELVKFKKFKCLRLAVEQNSYKTVHVKPAERYLTTVFGL